jgi:hypothetical protein
MMITLNLIPNWKAQARNLIVLLIDGDNVAKKNAEQELMRMAEAADRYSAIAKVFPDSEKIEQLFKGWVK